MKNTASHHHPSRQARRRASRSSSQQPSLAEQYLPYFNWAYEHIDRTDPHWHLEVLGSLIKSALVNLRQYLERNRSRALSWDDPCIVLHHPVQWNWQTCDATGVPRGGYLYGNFTPENSADVPTAQQTVGAMLMCRHTVEVLANATNWSWYHQRGKRTTPCLPAEFSESIRLIKDEGARRDLFERCLRPFVLEAPSGEGDEAGSQPDATPLVIFQGDTHGRQIRLPLIFEIHPLIADYDRQEAYHPIVVGFELGPEDGPSPAGWPPAERAQMWDELLEQADRLPALLRSQAEGAAHRSTQPTLCGT